MKTLQRRLALSITTVLACSCLGSRIASAQLGGGCTPPIYSNNTETLDVFTDSSGTVTDIGDIDIVIRKAFVHVDGAYCDVDPADRDQGWLIFFEIDVDIVTGWESTFPDAEFEFMGRTGVEWQTAANGDFVTATSFYEMHIFGDAT